MKSAKIILKMVLALIGGGLVGFGAVMLCFMVFADVSAADFLAKFQRVGWLSLLGVMLFSFVTLILAFLLQVVIHEGGHLVCGLYSGYRFVSFRILQFTLLKREGKWCIRRYDLAGTGGQCLLAPPDLPVEQIPVVLYNMAGVMANLLASLLVAALLLWADGPSLLESAGWQFCVVGLALALLNGIPLPGTKIFNDANNMLLLRRNMQSKRALMDQLRINAAAQEGLRPQQMPAEWFALSETDYKDNLQISSRLMRAGWLMDGFHWDEACRELEECYGHRDQMLGLLVDELACELMFALLMTGRKEEAERLYTLPLRKYIGHYRRVMSSKQRVLCAAKLYLEEKEAEALELWEALRRNRDRYLMQGEVAMDLALLDEMFRRRKEELREA